jgi:hypothetical protein
MAGNQGKKICFITLKLLIRVSNFRLIFMTKFLKTYSCCHYIRCISTVEIPKCVRTDSAKKKDRSSNSRYYYSSFLDKLINACYNDCRSIYISSMLNEAIQGQAGIGVSYESDPRSVSRFPNFL